MLESKRPLVHVIGELAAAGAEMFVKELALAQQSQSGLPVEVWTLYKASQLHANDPEKIDIEEGFLEAFNKAGIVVRQLDKRPGKDYFKTWCSLKAFAREADPLLINCHLEEVSFHVCAALGRSGIPIVQTMHSERVRRQLLYRLFFRRYCQSFVAISAEVGARTRAAMPGLREDQLVDIPNGIPVDRFTCPDRDYAKPPQRALAVGRLAPEKNHRLMIEAVALLKEKLGSDDLPDLAIYGVGPSERELAGLIEEKGLKKKVKLPGISSKVPQLLRESDIYLMSSDKEGMSISLMEAMAAGIPIVVTAVSGIKELIVDGESALVVPVGNRAEFAEAYARLIKDAELRRKLGRGAAAAVKPYSMETCAARYLNLYRSLL